MKLLGSNYLALYLDVNIEVGTKESDSSVDPPSAPADGDSAPSATEAAAPKSTDPAERQRGSRCIPIEDLRKLPVPELVPKGFLFMWVEKQHLLPVLEMGMAWGFRYVENLVWIKKGPNNRWANENSSVLSRSKATMLMMRRVSASGFFFSFLLQSWFTHCCSLFACLPRIGRRGGAQASAQPRRDL
jgi:hypothetical protein